MSLGGSTPSPSALMIGDRLMAGCLTLKQAMEVRILLPEPFGDRGSQFGENTAGWLLLVATPGSDPGGRWFDSNPRNFSSRSNVAHETRTRIPHEQTWKSSGRMRSLS